MITVSNISKSFGETKAVADLSFSIGKGEIVGLLGPNGAGKTTTMRMLTGFLSADSGLIKIGDFDILLNPLEAQKIIGYMPENNPIYKDMLVSELFDFIANIRDLKGSRRKEGIEFAVNSTGINEVYYYPIQELSKGFRQRVGMAMALLHRPAVLILDEPTEGLDPNQRTEVRHLIRKLAKGHTVLLSTHVMQEVEAVCSRLIIINNGRLVADGTPDKLIKTSGIKNSFLVILEGKNVYNVDGGINQIEFFSSNIDLPDDVFEYNPTLNFVACYAYQTISNPSVCVDPLRYQVSSEQKACDYRRSVITEGTQGAPVAVRSVRAVMVTGRGRSRAVFEIDVANAGNGQVLSTETDIRNCAAERFNYADLNKIAYHVQLSGGSLVNCNPADGFVRLNNGRGKIVCTFDIAEAAAFETPLLVTLDYNYIESFRKPIRIIQTPQ